MHLTWSLLFFTTEWCIRLVMLPVVIFRKRRPSVCLAWLSVIFFEPWLGLFFYMLVGENRLGRTRIQFRKRHEAPQSGPGHELSPEVAGLRAVPEEIRPLAELAVHMGGWPVVAGNRLEFVSETDEVIAKLVAAIEGANQHVHLLFYIFRDDMVGQRVAHALAAAAERGVACRVLADDVGSRHMLRSLGPWLERHGVAVARGLPANPLRRRFARLDLRNHRKLAIIDGQQAFVGSQNIVEASYGKRGIGAWRDIMAIVEGPAVAQLQDVFLEDWFHDTGDALEFAQDLPHPTVQGNACLQVVPTGPDRPTEGFQDLIVQSLYEAQEQITITSPYFVPDESLLMALRLAVARGVDVTLIVPEKSDMRLVDWATKYYCGNLVEFGVCLYYHQDGLLHAKTLTIDDSLALFGSANYDIRSFYLNFELNFLIYDVPLVANLRRLQAEYVAQSFRVEKEILSGRPWPNQLAENMAKLLSPIL